MGKMLALPIKLAAMMLVAALCLGGVNMATEERIAEQQRIQAEQMRLEVMPDAGAFTEIAVEGAKAYQSDAGYVFEMSANGFGGPIAVTVGIGLDGAITGVRVGSHAETPGLGAKATEAAFYGQYQGKAAQPLTVVKAAPTGASDIQAITAATITSRAVTDAVNQAIALYRAMQ